MVSLLTRKQLHGAHTSAGSSLARAAGRRANLEMQRARRICDKPGQLANFLRHAIDKGRGPETATPAAALVESMSAGRTPAAY